MVKETRIIATRKLPNGDELELLQLSEGWFPWSFQVRHAVMDGKAFGSPGKRIYTGWSNFIAEHYQDFLNYLNS